MALTVALGHEGLAPADFEHVLDGIRMDHATGMFVDSLPVEFEPRVWDTIADASAMARAEDGFGDLHNGRRQPSTSAEHDASAAFVVPARGHGA